MGDQRRDLLKIYSIYIDLLYLHSILWVGSTWSLKKLGRKNLLVVIINETKILAITD